jgi:hypothetical protein
VRREHLATQTNWLSGTARKPAQRKVTARAVADNKSPSSELGLVGQAYVWPRWPRRKKRPATAAKSVFVAELRRTSANTWTIFGATKFCRTNNRGTSTRSILTLEKALNSSLNSQADHPAFIFQVVGQTVLTAVRRREAIMPARSLLPDNTSCRYPLGQK